MVHVYVQKGKNFSLDVADEQGAKTFNALIQIASGGKSSYSKCLQNSATESESTIYWGEHFFFEPRNMTSDDIQSQSVSVTVLDKGVFRDTQVG
jgi:hypothetical protein